MPLLKGRIVFNDLFLQSPEIKLPSDISSGFETQLNLLQNIIGPQTNESGGAFEVQFKRVRIDNGKLTYYEQEQKKSLHGISLTLSSNSKYGPYKLSGHALFQDTKFDIDVKTGRISPDANSISLSSVLEDEGKSFRAEYSGIITPTDEALELQGELNLQALNL